MALPLSFDRKPARLYCGVSGWEHSDWDAHLYPQSRLRNFHPLRFLAARVDVLEAESVFRRIPRAETTSLWAAHVMANPNFRFSVPLHRDFTHERVLDEEKVRAFHDAMRPLVQAGRLGWVVMQMPASFRFNQENRDYLIRLRRAFHEYRLVAELRHKSWAADEALGTLVDYHVGIANLDQPEAAFAMPPASRLTGPTGYFKLYGRGPIPGHYEFAAPLETPQTYLYNPAVLEEWRGRIEYARRFSNDVCVVFANSASACSVTNALQMAGLLETQPAQRPGRAPRSSHSLAPFRAA